MQWPLQFNIVNVTSQIWQTVLAPQMCGGQRFPPHDSGRRFSYRDFTGYLRVDQQKKHSRQQALRCPGGSFPTGSLGVSRRVVHAELFCGVETAQALLLG